MRVKEKIVEDVKKFRKNPRNLKNIKELSSQVNDNLEIRDQLFFCTLPYILKVARKYEPNSFEELFQKFSLNFLEHLKKYKHFIHVKEEKYQLNSNLNYFFNQMYYDTLSHYISEKLTIEFPNDYVKFRKEINQYITNYINENLKEPNVTEQLELITFKRKSIDSLFIILNQFQLRYSLSTLPTDLEEFTEKYKFIELMGLFYDSNSFEKLEKDFFGLENITDHPSDFDINTAYLDSNIEAYEIYDALLNVKELMIKKYRNIINSNKNNFTHRKDNVFQNKILILDLIFNYSVNESDNSKIKYETIVKNIIKNKGSNNELVGIISSGFDLGEERARQLYNETVNELKDTYINSLK
jgi:hypothetical protein